MSTREREFRLPAPLLWFRVRWPDDGQGVVLVTRIPGYLSQTTPHENKDAAERAAAAIYDEYRAAIEVAKAS
jgi:hypothetical protein